MLLPGNGHEESGHYKKVLGKKLQNGMHMQCFYLSYPRKLLINIYLKFILLLVEREICRLVHYRVKMTEG